MKLTPILALVGASAFGSLHAEAPTSPEWMVRNALTTKPAAPWQWVRPSPDGHRITAEGLEVRVLPGNLWGPANDAHNTLTHPVPAIESGGWEIAVTVSNRPSSQYEQVNVAWYYDDSHMIKLGLEQVDGKRCIVMGREFADKAQTLGIIPVEADTVRLRLTVRGRKLVGHYQVKGSTEWHQAGEGPLPIPSDAEKPALAALQFYQGPADAEHWARVCDFTIRRVP